MSKKYTIKPSDTVIELKTEKKILATYSQLFYKHDWVKKPLGAIDGKYILVGLSDAGEYITENWKLK